MDKRQDLMTGIIMALVSLWYLFEAAQVKVFAGMGKAIIDSGTIPKVWGGCLLVLSIILIIRGFRGLQKEGQLDKFNLWDKVKEHWEVVGTFILLTIYIGIMDYLGFVIASMIYIFFQILVLTPKEKRNYKMAGILAVIFSISIYYVFVEWLMVLLPVGLLEF